MDPVFFPPTPPTPNDEVELNVFWYFFSFHVCASSRWLVCTTFLQWTRCSSWKSLLLRRRRRIRLQLPFRSACVREKWSSQSETDRDSTRRASCFSWCLKFSGNSGRTQPILMDISDVTKPCYWRLNQDCFKRASIPSKLTSCRKLSGSLSVLLHLLMKLVSTSVSKCPSHFHSTLGIEWCPQALRMSSAPWSTLDC